MRDDNKSIQLLTAALQSHVIDPIILILAGSQLSILLITAIAFVACSLPSIAYAGPANGSGGKNLSLGSSSTASHSTSLDLDTSFDPVMSVDINDFNQYERRTIKLFESLHEISQPLWNPDDPDIERAEHAAQKAFLIQSARGASFLVKGSELYPTYQSVKRGLSEIQESFRYSLQSDDASVYLSKEKKGAKVLELNLEFNVSQGLDPQILIADTVRFRYDIIEKRQILEYQLDF